MRQIAEQQAIGRISDNDPRAMSENNEGSLQNINS
jgi:hypothetical protein